MTAVKFSTLANPTVIVTAIVYGLMLRLGSAAGLFGFLLWLMVMLSLWRYGYAVLRHVASGWTNFPPPEIESMNPAGEFAVVFHSLLFSLLLFLLATTPFVEGLLRWLLLGLVLAVFPASAAVMAMTRNAGAALNPVNLVSLVRDLGADYGRLLAVSGVLGACMAFASWIAEAYWFLAAIGDMLAVWTVLALFLATGAALRAHRHEFDLLEALDDTEERELKRRQADWQDARSRLRIGP